jgi:hypothetical protein
MGEGRGFSSAAAVRTGEAGKKKMNFQVCVVRDGAE